LNSQPQLSIPSIIPTSLQIPHLKILSASNQPFIERFTPLLLEQINKGESTFKFNPFRWEVKIMREARFIKALTVAVTVDAYDKIKQITDDEKISMTRWVRQAINKALDGDAVEEE